MNLQDEIQKLITHALEDAKRIETLLAECAKREAEQKKMASRYEEYEGVIKKRKEKITELNEKARMMWVMVGDKNGE